MVHWTEAAIVRRVFEAAVSRVRPQIIAEQLNQEKVPGVGGRAGRWTARQILKMLSYPVYAGAVRDKASARGGQHEAIVAPAVFDRVRKCIEARRSRAPGRTVSKVPWPLRGLLVCAVCGRAMSPSISGYKQFAYRYYRCRSRAFGRPPCKDVGISAYVIEEFVRAALGSDPGSSAEQPSELAEFANVWKQLDDR
jgi:site-specific DNA recombinase